MKQKHHQPPEWARHKPSRAKSSDPRDAKGRLEHERWVASLSADEKEQIRQVDPGLLQYLPAGTKAAATGYGGDVAESPAASIREEVAESEPEPHSPIADVIRRIVGEILSSSNARLTVECLALSTDLCYQGNSEREIGRRHGISRSAVSARCVELCAAFGLKPSRAMKTLAARINYRKARKNKVNQNSAH